MESILRKLKQCGALVEWTSVIEYQKSGREFKYCAGSQFFKCLQSYVRSTRKEFGFFRLIFLDDIMNCAKRVARFVFLGVGKNFRLLMQSCCFFFSRPFHENFKFLKNCPYDFHEILHSHSTPKGAPACAKASKSYGWDVRNIAKISPKMAKKQPFFDFFRFSQKLSIRFERNFLQIFCTILESYMCNGIKIVWLGCEKHSQN